MKPLSDMLAALGDIKPNPAVKGPECASCDDTGWKQVDGGGVIRCPDCYERRRGFAPGVPEDEAKTTLDSFSKGDYTVTHDNEAAIQQGRFFVQDVHPGLYLHGTVGSGKTAIACAILNELHRMGRTVRFVRVTELLKQLVQDDGDQVQERMVNLPVLVLDDIGAQKGSDYARAALVMVYDARNDRRHRTIWTSNLTLDELVNFFEDQRLPSRIAGHAKVVAVDGQDYRLRKARRRS